MRRSLALLALLTLTGCQTASGFSWDATDDRYCREQLGLEKGTALYAQCRMSREQMRSANRPKSCTTWGQTVTCY